MEKISTYDVSFSGLSLGKHIFEFDIDQAFFDVFTFDQEFSKPAIKTLIEVEKKANFLNLTLQSHGEMELICDVLGKPYSQPIHAEWKWVIKFGEEDNREDDEIWILPQGAYEFNAAQVIFDTILLAIPMKHISKEGKKEQDKFESLSEEIIEKEPDPRWEALKKLKK